MLILNQLKNKAVNLDNMESIEIDYGLGNAYAIVKAVGWRPLDSAEFSTPSTVKLGEYKSSLTAENVIRDIYTAYANEARCFSMPEDMHNA